MSKSRRLRKGSSKAGRPKKAGDRYPSGKLKPPGPNIIVLRRREQGDALGGDHPLDFALARKWITERQHKDAMAYRATFNRAHICGPRLSIGRLSERPASEELRINWSQMSDAEIVAIFDQVFGGEIMPEDAAKRDEQAMGRWRLLNAALAPAEREELFRVCVLGSWPFWMPKRAAGHALGGRDLEKEARLFSALGAVGRAMHPLRRKADAITPVPFRRTRAGRTEAAIRYETPDGEEVEPTSEHGKPFEAAILRRRA